MKCEERTCIRKPHFQYVQWYDSTRPLVLKTAAYDKRQLLIDSYTKKIVLTINMKI